MTFLKKIGLNLLLVFIPVTLALEHLAPERPALIFVAAAFGIIPLAGLIVQATEQIAHRTGDAIGGLLNATFGNAPELIISFVALKAGFFDMVRASLVGAMLFGIHPLHVASVAWVTERKDVLYALFFLGSVIAYLQHRIRK